MLRVSSGSPFEPTIGFSRAVRAGDRVPVSGTGPVWPSGEVDPDADAVGAAHGETMVVVAGLLDLRRVVEIEAEAQL